MGYYSKILEADTTDGDQFGINSLCIRIWPPRRLKIHSYNNLVPPCDPILLYLISFLDGPNAATGPYS